MRHGTLFYALNLTSWKIKVHLAFSSFKDWTYQLLTEVSRKYASINFFGSCVYVILLFVINITDKI